MFFQNEKRGCVESVTYCSQSVEKLRTWTATKWAPWLILSCGWCFYLYEYMLRVSPSAITSDLMLAFGVNATHLGVLVSFYYLSYVALQIPCGLIVDVLGARRVITGSALLCVVGSFLFAKSDTLWVAQMGRFLMGAGSACAYLSCGKIASQWFHKNQFPLIMGVSMSMGTLGATFGAKPFAYLSNAIGWRDAMMIAGYIGICVMILAWLIVRVPCEIHQQEGHDRDVSWQSLWRDLCTIAGTWQNWLVGLYGCLMYLSLSAFAELWGVPYIIQKYGLPNDQASVASVVFFVCFGVGSAISSYVARLLRSYKLVMMWGALLSLMALAMEFYGPSVSFHKALVLFAVAGVASGFQILYFTIARDNSPPQAHSTSIGFMNFCVMVSGLLFPTLLGWILDSVWDGQMTVEGVPQYTVNHYTSAFYVVCLALFLSAVLMCWVKETYTHRDEEEEAA
jgi:predicted MFS family arabinose efflux permease